MFRRCPAPLIVLSAALAIGLGAVPPSSRADTLTSNSNTNNTQTVTLEYTLKVNQSFSPVSGSPPGQGSANPPTPEMLAMVSPVSIVTPPSSSNSGPLAIAADTGGSTSGYYANNPNEVSVYVGNIPANGSPITQQALGLSFYGQGLTKGESIGFTLTFDKAVYDAAIANGGSGIQFTAYNPSTLQPYSSGSSPFTISFDKLVSGTSSSGSSASTSTSSSSSASAAGSSSSTSTSSSTSVSGGGTPLTEQGGSGGGTTVAPEPFSMLVWAAMAGAGAWQVLTRRRVAADRAR